MAVVHRPDAYHEPLAIPLGLAMYYRELVLGAACLSLNIVAFFHREY